MAKVETIFKLFFLCFLIQFASSQELNKTSSNLRSIKIKELETNNNWRIIDLSHNSIESIDFPDLLRKQIDLETLRLNSNFNFTGRGNQQIFIHKTMKNFECVTCGFTEVQSQYFAGLAGLEKLLLNDNQINRVDDSAFKSNENLKLVDLTGNRIKTVQHSLFVGLKKLEALHLTMNPIELPKKKPFIKSNSLKRLKMNDCNMTTIYTETFSELGGLEALDLNRNLIQSLPVDAFKLNVKLKSLLIESNQLKNFSIAMVDMLPQLTELCIDNNNFTINPELVEFVKKYDEKKLRTDNCNDNLEYFIENILSTNSTLKAAKFVKKFINEGISDFFIGSYISTIIILQAVIFVFLSLYLIKITKYEKLEGDVNYANTILNDDEIYKVYKSDE